MSHGTIDEMKDLLLCACPANTSQSFNAIDLIQGVLSDRLGGDDSDDSQSVAARVLHQLRRDGLITDANRCLAHLGDYKLRRQMTKDGLMERVRAKRRLARAFNQEARA